MALASSTARSRSLRFWGHRFTDYRQTFCRSCLRAKSAKTENGRRIAYVMIDAAGTPWQGSGLCATARDLARFGEMLRRGGELNGHQIFDPRSSQIYAKAVIGRSSRHPGSTSDRAIVTITSGAILHNADGRYEASGAYGQMIHINPAAQMVVVKLSSHPVAGAGFTHALTLKAWAALAQAVRQSPNKTDPENFANRIFCDQSS